MRPTPIRLRPERLGRTEKIVLAAFWALVIVMFGRQACAETIQVPIATAFKLSWCPVQYAKTYGVLASCGSGPGNGPEPVRVDMVSSNLWTAPGMEPDGWCEYSVVAYADNGSQLFTTSPPSEPSPIFHAVLPAGSTIPSYSICTELIPSYPPGDVNRNGVVDAHDLALMTGCTQAATVTPECEAADLDRSGAVNMDFKLFLHYYTLAQGELIP